jgi:hypothetical protein
MRAKKSFNETKAIRARLSSPESDTRQTRESCVGGQNYLAGDSPILNSTPPMQGGIMRRQTKG